MKKLIPVLGLLAAFTSVAWAGDYDRYKCNCSLHFFYSPVSYPGWDNDLYVFGRDAVDAEIAVKAECKAKPSVDDGIGHTYYPELIKGSCQIVR